MEGMYPASKQHRLISISLNVFLCTLLLAAVATEVYAQSDVSALQVANVSTDRASTVLVSWSNAAIGQWTDVHIERSMSDSSWAAVATIQYPASYHGG